MTKWLSEQFTTPRILLLGLYHHQSFKLHTPCLSLQALNRVSTRNPSRNPLCTTDVCGVCVCVCVCELKVPNIHRPSHTCRYAQNYDGSVTGGKMHPFPLGIDYHTIAGTHEQRRGVGGEETFGLRQQISPRAQVTVTVMLLLSESSFIQND